ncbi:hypothetical protein, partial [Bilophila wadsworthia]
RFSREKREDIFLKYFSAGSFTMRESRERGFDMVKSLGRERGGGGGERDALLQKSSLPRFHP